MVAKDSGSLLHAETLLQPCHSRWGRDYQCHQHYGLIEQHLVTSGSQVEVVQGSTACNCMQGSAPTWCPCPLTLLDEVSTTRVCICLVGRWLRHLACPLQADDDIIIEYVTAPIDLDALQLPSSSSNHDEEPEEQGYGGLGLGSAPGLGSSGLGLGFGAAPEKPSTVGGSSCKQHLQAAAAQASSTCKQQLQVANTPVLCASATYGM